MIDPLRPPPGVERVTPAVPPARPARDHAGGDRRRRREDEPDEPADDGSADDDGLPHVDIRA